MGRTYSALFVLFLMGLPAAASNRHEVSQILTRLPLSFELNAGQVGGPIGEQTKFISRGKGYTLLLTPTEAVLSLGKVPLRMKLLGANPSPAVTGVGELPGKSNYFIGNDPGKWRVNVPTFARVKYEGVYPGVDLFFYGNQRQLEHDFVLAPGADPTAIRLGFEGAGKMKIDARGDLLLDIPGQQLRLHKPRVYQVVGGERREIAGRYVRKGRRQVGFEVASYDAGLPLVIDPVMSYSTLLGCNGDDEAFAMAVDSSDNVYLAGRTNSTVCPAIFPLGGLQEIFGGGSSDATVAKVNAAGTSILYTTYLGGTGTDVALGVAVDGAGNAYVTGWTNSINFPTSSPLQAGYGGGAADAFVTKINPTGSAIIYSTYVGGGDGEEGSGIAVDPAGNAYVAGDTASTNFPLSGPVQGTYGGGTVDAVIFKLGPSGTSLVYSTYLGGSLTDRAIGIALDPSGNAYVAGVTLSTNFPVASPLQGAFGGGQDAFVAKLNPAGSALIYSTYLGGSHNESGFAIAVDAAGSAFVTGFTRSTNFPTAGPIQATLGGGTCGTLPCADAFVSKLNAAGSALLYSTYLGGNDNESGRGIAVDSSGNAHITGDTNSLNFPRVNAVQSGYMFGGDAFVTKLNASGSALLYSTYLGGSAQDVGYAIAIDSGGNALVTGRADSTNFIRTPNALQDFFAGGARDAFLTKIADINPVPTIITLSPSSATAGGAGFTMTINGTNFVSGSIVRWNQSERATVFVSSSQLQASIVPSDIATAGTAQVTVFNPAPGGGGSVARTFTINSLTGNPVPRIDSLSPDSVPARGAAFALTVNGTNFVSGSVVRWNGNSRTTTFVNSAQLQAAISATDISLSGTAQITVFNPSPGGGTSNTLSFVITSTTTTCTGPVEPTLNITLPGPAFYIAEVRTAPGTLEGYWGMEVLVQRGVLSGGFNLGGAAQENGTTAGFGAFYLPGTQAVQFRMDMQVVPPGDPSKFSMAVRLLNSARQQLGTEQLGTTFVAFERTLTEDFYIVEVRSGTSAPRATFQLGLGANAFGGGVNVGGFVAPGLVGFGAFYVPETQEVKIKTQALPTFPNVGARCLRLTLRDANRNVIRTVP